MPNARIGSKPRPRQPILTGQRFVAGLLRSIGLPAPAKQRRRPRDFQRTKVYRWERAHVHNLLDAELLSLDECRTLVRQAFLWRERPAVRSSWSPPQVTDGRGRRHACGSRAVIKLPRWSRHSTIVLHECAHGMAADSHGPEFVARYIELLVQFLKMDGHALHQSALAAGVKSDWHSNVAR